MDALAIWRRLDAPGHDAALLTRGAAGWALRGTAVFKHEAGPACLNYSVDIDPSWATRYGRVQGFVADRAIDHVISREPGGWHLDGRLVAGLERLQDLDYGFTPATNLQHLRRVALEVGQVADIPVAWFDIDAPGLTELPQRYERRGEATYWYCSTSAPYEALLEMSPNGFVRSYPQLWEMER